MSKRARLLLLAERFNVFVAVVTVLAFAYLWLAAPLVQSDVPATSALPPVSAAPEPSASVSEPSEPAEESRAGEDEQETSEYACENE